jgi:hypothetical protein
VTRLGEAGDVGGEGIALTRLGEASDGGGVILVVSLDCEDAVSHRQTPTQKRHLNVTAVVPPQTRMRRPSSRLQEPNALPWLPRAAALFAGSLSGRKIRAATLETSLGWSAQSHPLHFASAHSKVTRAAQSAADATPGSLPSQARTPGSLGQYPWGCLTRTWSNPAEQSNANRLRGSRRSRERHTLERSSQAKILSLADGESGTGTRSVSHRR